MFAFTNVIDDFCDVEGLTVEEAFVVDLSDKTSTHKGLVYFHEKARVSQVFTNLANGRFVTSNSNVLQKDQRVTDNGDGTLTVVYKATGNATLYGEDGKAIGRNPRANACMCSCLRTV